MRLDALNERLADYRLARKSSSLGWLFGNRETTREPLKGLYIYGEVGRGKTMLMDMFFAACPAHRKRRAHFHEFMADVHERVYDYRRKIKRGEMADADPITLVADDIATEAWVLCFDEFHVDDIADAMILGRLFTASIQSRRCAGGDLQSSTGRALRGWAQPRAVPAFHRAAEASGPTVIRLDSRTDFPAGKTRRHEGLARARKCRLPTAALDAAWQRLTAGTAAAKR